MASFEGGGDWPAYEQETRKVMEVSTSAQVLVDPGGAERDLWNGLP